MTKRLPARFRVCDECGKEYQIKNTLSRFCSRACMEKSWGKRHPGYMAAAQRRYLENPLNKTRRAAYQREYRNRPSSVARANALRNGKYKNDVDYRENAKARARSRHCSYQIGHTRAQWEALKLIYNNRCAYCGRKMKRLTKDHIVPISQGDPAEVDGIENILPACKSCNSRKNIRQPFPYQRTLSTGVVIHKVMTLHPS